MVKQNCKCYFRKYAWDKLWQYGKPRQFGSKVNTNYVSIHNGQEVQKERKVLALLLAGEDKRYEKPRFTLADYYLP